MKNQQFATLKEFTRLNNSVMGNPNYEVTLDAGDGELFTLRSSSNSSWCYGIANNWVDKTVSYHTTKAGRVDYMKLTTIQDTFTDPILSGKDA